MVQEVYDFLLGVAGSEITSPAASCLSHSAMLQCDIGMAVCLSVRTSVLPSSVRLSHTGIPVVQRQHVFDTHFRTLCPRGTPLRGLHARLGEVKTAKKCRFLTSKSLQLGNDRTLAHSYNRRRIGSRILVPMSMTLMTLNDRNAIELLPQLAIYIEANEDRSNGKKIAPGL